MHAVELERPLAFLGGEFLEALAHHFKLIALDGLIDHEDAVEHEPECLIGLCHVALLLNRVN